MRGTAAILVCLISLHHLSVIDAYSARFTSENGMPGREHEDKHPRKSADVRRSVPASPDTSLRQYPQYDYDNYGGIPNIPPFEYRDADLDSDIVDADADANASGVSKTLQRLLNSVVDGVRRLWGKLGVKPSESAAVESAGADTKRKNARNEASKKRAMDCCNGGGSGTTKRDRGIIANHLTYLTDMAKKALDLAYDVIDGIDVSKLTEETKKMKEAVMEALKKAKDALGEMIDNVVRGIESGGDLSPSLRRTRSVGKRTNTRDALEAYMTGLRSRKRSNVRKSLRQSAKGDTPARASEMTALLNMMTEMEECIDKMPARNAPRLGVKCIVLPMMKVLASPKRAGANGLTMDADSNVRSNKIESGDNLRRLSFPWGSIFLIPIYDGLLPSGNTTTTTTTTTTTPSYPDHTVNDPEFDNTTTTTTEPPTTTTLSTTTSSTTEAMPTWPDSEHYPVDPPVYPESEKEVRDDSRYRSKYDNDF